MARNNNNRPRVNNRTRNLSSFIPQPRVSITEREDISTDNSSYIYSHPWTDYISSSNLTFLDMSSTSPIQSVPLDPDEVDPNTNLSDSPDISEQAFNITMGNGSNLWISREELERQREYVAQRAQELVSRPLSPVQSVSSTQFNRPYDVRDREGNIIPRERFEEIMADRESRLRDVQRERERQLFENRSNSIGDYIAWLSSQNISPQVLQSPRAGRAITGYSGSMIFGTLEVRDEEPAIYGERFDNVIIISNRNPLSSYTRQAQGWGKGFVILESDNMLSKRSANWETLDIDVHGGITYNNKITEDFIETKFGKSLHLTSDDIGKTILGFDTSHYSSKELFPTRESVLEHTTKLALQCAAY